MNRQIKAYIEYLSSPPFDSTNWGVGNKEGNRWEYKCVQEVLPGLLKYIKRKGATREDVDLVLRALEKAYSHPETGSYSRFNKIAWSITEKCNEIDNNTTAMNLCVTVLTTTNPHFWWSKVVKIIQASKIKEAAPMIITGLLKRYKSRMFLDMFNEKDVEAAIEAILFLEIDNKQEIIMSLLKAEDTFFRKMVINALGKCGDRDVVPLLKKRLGRFIKVEKDSFMRQLIRSAIGDIVRRGYSDPQ